MRDLEESSIAVERDDGHTVVSGSSELSAPLASAVQPEGSAEDASARPVVEARLFQAAAPPREVELGELPALAADDACFVWVDLSDYRAADLDAVARELDLPEAAMRITLAGWQRPRLDVFGDRFFVAVTVPRSDGRTRHVLASELDLVVGQNYLVSVHKQPLPFAETALARATQDPNLLRLDSAFLLSILLDELLDHYESLTEGLQDEIEALEERALTDRSDAFLADMLQMKRYVFAIYRLAGQHRAVLAAFLRPDSPLVGGDRVEPYFRDLQERLGRLLDGLEASKETVNGAFDIYVSQVSRRANDIMTVLAVVSTVLLPATVILGLFSTNFQALEPTIGFISMIASVILVSALALVVFYRWGWLGAPAVAPRDSGGRGEPRRGDHSRRGNP